MMRISLVGATGLVGRHFLQLALESERVEEVVALVRRPLVLRHPKLLGRVVDFERIVAGAPSIPRGSLGETMVVALGSTRKKAGSRDAFTRVDRDYVVACARWGLAAGVRNFCLVSATGANARSPVFYNRTKGEAEQAVGALGFSAVHLLRPSLLLGQREEKRWGERLAQAMSPALNALLWGPMRRYRAVEAEEVARALFAAAVDPRAGVFFHESEEFQAGPRSLQLSKN
jgi:uncharacterized protein YbjT (DUF2867 family)